MKYNCLMVTRRKFILVLLILFPFVQNVYAGGLAVSPVRIYLSPQQPRQAIELRNPGDKSVLVEAAGFLWRQVEGQDELTATQDIITAPPVFTVAPGQTQIIRVGFRRQPKAEKELSYRIILSQVPDQVTPDQGVNIVLRMSLPVFYTPRKTEPTPEWTLSGNNNELELSLHNSGLQHLQIKKITLLSSADSDVALAEIEGAGYVLPGSSRSWSVKPLQTVSAKQLLLKMETTRGEMEYKVTLSD